MENELNLKVDPKILKEFEAAMSEFNELTRSKPRVKKVIETMMQDFTVKVMGSSKKIKSEQFIH